MSDMKPKRYWTGSAPVKCDMADTIASRKHDIRGNFIDGRTSRGPWAIMCLHCARIFGTGIGQGKGQHYQIQEDGRWLKVEG